MGFNNTASTTGEVSRGFHILSEKLICFTFPTWSWVTSVNCILSIVCSKYSSECVRCLRFSLRSWSRANQTSPFLNCIFRNKFKSSYNIACHLSNKIIVEWFPSMFSIELTCTFITEFTHLQFADYETVLLYSIYNFPSVSIWIRFNNCKGFLSFALKLLTSEKISIFH